MVASNGVARSQAGLPSQIAASWTSPSRPLARIRIAGYWRSPSNTVGWMSTTAPQEIRPTSTDFEVMLSRRALVPAVQASRPSARAPLPPWQ